MTKKKQGDAPLDETEHFYRLFALMPAIPAVPGLDGWLSPEDIGSKLAPSPGLTITLGDVRQACELLVAAGRLRTAGGHYSRSLRESAAMQAEIVKLVEECVTSIYPEGNGAQITAVTLPACIAQLRTDHEQLRASLGNELTLRHSAERDLATTKDRHKVEIARLEKLLEDERVASGQLLDKVKALGVVFAGLFG